MKKVAERRLKVLADEAIKLAGVTPAQEKAVREQFAFGTKIEDQLAFFESLPLTHGLTPLEQDECLHGHKLNAIKLVRERTNMDLVMAKKVILDSGFLGKSEHDGHSTINPQ